MCAASKQKFLQGLNNTSTEGVKAFESLESLVDNLAKHGAEAAWVQETVQKLKAGKQYLKGEYKCHLGSNEMCANHCTVYSLPDPEKEFSEACKQEHNLTCLDCKNIRDVLGEIRRKIEDKDLDLTQEQKDKIAWDLDYTISDIESWKAHLVRSYQQDLARQDSLRHLDDNTILMIDDWVMKLVPMRFRETQSQWFGKHGLSWHFAAVIHLSDHPDCKPVDSNEYHIHIFIVVFDSCEQDWFSVCCIVEEVLEAFKKSHPSVTKAHLQSDNAGCYHNAPLLSTINAISKCIGIEGTRYDFSDPQAGKDLYDRRIAPCKQWLQNFVSENNNIEKAEDVKKGLESPPGICGTQVAVGQIDTSKMSKNVSKNNIPNITKYNNFTFEKEGISVWQAYGIRKGLKINTFNHVQEISGMKETSGLKNPLV